MKYQLTFGGVPFVPDEAHPIRLPQHEGEGADLPPLARFRPAADLVDEVNRMLPFRYLQDLAPASESPGYGLTALGLPSRAPLDPRLAHIEIGDWYYPTTASRFSVFRGLATSSQVKEMPRSGTFVMKVVPDGKTEAEYTLSTTMRMLPPRTIAETVGFDGLFLVTLVDERFYFRGTPVTLQPTSTTTWADLLTQTATSLGITLTVPTIDAVYGQPEPDSQLWCQFADGGLLLDALAYNIGCTVVRKLDGTYRLLSPTTSTISRPSVRLAGGDIFASGSALKAGDLRAWRNSVVPASVTVTFPKLVTDPVPHFLNSRYASGRPSAWYEDSYDVHAVSVAVASGGILASGLTGNSTEIIHDTAKALYSGEVNAASGMAPSNASGLTALAMQLAGNLYGYRLAASLDEVYAGTLKWEPEGLHDIVWTHSVRARRAQTRVMRAEWNYAPNRCQHSFSGNVGVAGHSVAQTWRDLSGAVTYGTTLVTAGSGLTAIAGSVTSGGVSEVVLMGASVVASGGPAAGYSSGGVSSGYYTDYACPDVAILRLYVSGSVYFRSLSFPAPISGSPTGREMEIVNAAPLPGAGEAPQTITYPHEDISGTSSMRFATPDGYPVIQQPQEAIRLKYTDGRWKFGELRPINPFTNTMGGGSPAGPLSLRSGAEIPYPQIDSPKISNYITLPATSPPTNMPIPSAGFVNMTVVPLSTTSGPIPVLEFVNTSGLSGYLPVVSGMPLSGSLNSGAYSSGSMGWYVLSSGAVRSGHVGDNAVVSGSVASGQIAALHLSSGCVRSGHVGDAAIVSGSMASGFAAIVGRSGINVTLDAPNSWTLGMDYSLSGRITSGMISSGAIGNTNIIVATVFSGYFPPAPNYPATASPRWVKVTADYASFSGASSSKTVDMYTVPANGYLHNVSPNTRTIWGTTAGGGPPNNFSNSTLGWRAGIIADSTAGFVVAGQFTWGANPLDGYPVTVGMASTGAKDAIGSTYIITATVNMSTGTTSDLVQGVTDIYLLISFLE